MTGWADATTAIIQADRKPDCDDERLLDVRPGAGTAFDGDRFWTTLQFVYGDRDSTLYGRDDVGEALDDAIAHVRGGGTVRLCKRARLRHDWSRLTIRAFEEKLAAAAAETDGRLLTWTVDEPEPDDEELYDVVVRQ